ncbi:MAG: preprotein translocase subunit SecA [Fibrobacteraceae bacterium]|mgnify:FL=1|nr:preprotein translocase subunit SecA [Fibrobacteraceae bacterium]
MSIVDKVLHKVFGTPHERKVKRLRPIIAEINKTRKELEHLSDKELALKSDEFRTRLKEGASLEDIKIEAFAVCQEACDRRLGIFNIFDESYGFDFGLLGPELAGAVQKAKEELKAGVPEYEVYLPAELYAKVRELYPDSVKPFRMMPFDVQMIGGLVLHEGAIAEMATGEGKTLAAACPVYLNGLSGKGVHVVTVNDYLAGRDAKQMGRVYNFLGLKVGLIVNGLDSDQRRASYGADVTYGTNNEFGFDYLRDNMAVTPQELVQRELNFCIVDEVDSILIDEARTPLIISGPAEDATDKYIKADALVQQLKRGTDYMVDEKNKTVQITERGVNQIESILKISNLYGEHAEWVHFITQSLRAWNLFERDVDYLVREGEIVIIDENTGRLMEGRRYSEGMHQAIEAKEKVQIRRENQTLATITFQNYFRMYNKLSGMTGTAETEATEFIKIYNMPTWVIPTHKPCIRKDLNDLVYKTEEAKWKSIVSEIKRRHKAGQPILVGTASVEKSEKISQMLKREGIEHEVLNAKNHGREAEIIQFAGHMHKVTVATNMAGRGTDIALGPGAAEVGGLHVLGTERHESRRIDNQLRGRSGRQGDPGSSQYFLSLDDNLVRIFGGANIKKMMERFGLGDDDVIVHPLVSRSIRGAQRRVEGQSFDARKYLLDYDDVMNEQRKVIYTLRRRILNEEDVRQDVWSRIEEAADIKVSQYVFANTFPEEWKLEDLHVELSRCFAINYNLSKEEATSKTAENVLDEVLDLCKKKYDKLIEIIPDKDFKNLERHLLLRTIDQHWKEHLYAMDQLKDSIRFHGYAQKDPLMVYKGEGFKLFEKCLESIAMLVTMRILNIRIQLPNGMSVPPEMLVKREDAPKTNNPDEVAPEDKMEVSIAQESIPPKPEAPTQTVTNKEPENSPMPQSALPGTRPIRRRPMPVKSDTPKVGRNDPCWCGSGLKFKKCHGKNEE